MELRLGFAPIRIHTPANGSAGQVALVLPIEDCPLYRHLALAAAYNQVYQKLRPISRAFLGHFNNMIKKTPMATKMKINAFRIIPNFITVPPPYSMKDFTPQTLEYHTFLL